MTLTLTLRCVIVIVIVVVDEKHDESNEYNNILYTETIDIYGEMLKIMKQNELQYNKFSSYQKYKPQIEPKYTYTVSKPIPIPIPHQ